MLRAFIWYTLWPFSNLLAIWCISPRVGIVCQKIWQPWLHAT
jgi:hypothetical protein